MKASPTTGPIILASSAMPSRNTYFAALLSLLISSCATISTGTTSKVHLRGKPGTAFETSNGVQGHVPATVTLPNGQVISIRYDSDGDGSLDAVHRSTPRRSGASAGNLLMGGVVGLAVDASNPKTRVHSRTQNLGPAYQLELAPEIKKDLLLHGVTAEEFLAWPEYRRSQAEVNLSDREYAMWRKYNDLIRDQYEQEAQEAIALAKARLESDPATALEAAEHKAAAEREAQMPPE